MVISSIAVIRNPMPPQNTVPVALLTRNNVSAGPKSTPAPATKPLQNQPDSHHAGIAAATQCLAAKFFHNQFPEAKYCDHPDCQRDHALRCDLDLQLNHSECRSPERRVLLAKIYRKVNYELDSGRPGYWNNQRRWKNYDQTATIIALSTYERRQAFCNCGFYGYSCGDRLLCPRDCFNLLAKPALREFRRAFHADNECYYVVTGLSREADEKKRLIFKDLTKSEMDQIKVSGCAEQDGLDNYGIPFKGPTLELECQAYWRIFHDVIHEFTGHGKLFSGAFGGPELAVRFLPLAVLPHANYIVWSPDLCGDDVRRLRRALRNKLRGCRKIKLGLYPKVSVYRIQSKADFQAVIRYIFKPIDVGFAYAVAANAVGNDRQALARLNFQTDCFLEDLPTAFYGVHRMTRFGFCSASSSDYVGAVSAERQERREKDAQRRKRRQRKAAQIREQFPAYQPHKRKMTKKHRDVLFLMRAWHRQLVRDGELPGKPPKRWLKKMTK